MANDVIHTLDLDNEGLKGKLILVKENSGCDGSFFHSCFISKQIKDKGAICLVTVHNDFNHYYSVGMKMGYNLKTLKDTGSVINIDFLDIVSNHIDLNESVDFVSILFSKIENAIRTLRSKHSSVCLIVDDLTHLSNLKFTITDINLFILKCSNYVINDEQFCVVFGTHVTSSNDDSFIVSQLVSHMADIVCDVSNLKTGRSVDVSGSFKILKPWLDNDSTSLSTHTKLNNYLFKLFDRGVKVFAPGLR